MRQLQNARSLVSEYSAPMPPWQRRWRKLSRNARHRPAAQQFRRRARRNRAAGSIRDPANWLCFAQSVLNFPPASLAIGFVLHCRSSSFGQQAGELALFCKPASSRTCVIARSEAPKQSRPGKLALFFIATLIFRPKTRQIGFVWHNRLHTDAVIARSEASLPSRRRGRQSRPEGLALFGIFATPALPSVPTDSTCPPGANSATLRPQQTSNSPRLNPVIDTTRRGTKHGMNSVTESTGATLGSHIGWCTRWNIHSL